MAKKTKKNAELPEGMSRRQAKLAARAAERAALAAAARPFAGLAIEADLVALQEFVPSAHAALPLDTPRPIRLVTVLPSALAGAVRGQGDSAEVLVALQGATRSLNPAGELAAALEWAKQAEPGSFLNAVTPEQVAAAPELSSLLGEVKQLQVVAASDFNWWVPEGEQLSQVEAEQLRYANEALPPSEPVTGDFTGKAWWIDAGSKAHIRWIRTDEEGPLLAALARIGARGELKLGEDTRFAGVFRTHGILVPVFDLDPTVPAASYGPLLAALDTQLAAEIANDAPLSSEERRYLENIKSRQVTIR